MLFTVANVRGSNPRFIVHCICSDTKETHDMLKSNEKDAQTEKKTSSQLQKGNVMN